MADSTGSKQGAGSAHEHPRETPHASQERGAERTLVREILETTSDGILILDIDGRVAHYNERFLELWAVDRAEIHGRPGVEVSRLLAPRTSDPQLFMEPKLNGPERQQLDLISLSDGRVLERRSRTAHAAAGLIWSFRDVTDRERAAELLRNELQFRQLVAGVADYAIYMLDLNGNVASWNSGAARIKGYQATEIIGKHFSRFYTDEDRAGGKPQRALSIAAKEGKYEAEAWRVRKDGTRFWASVVIDAIHGADGRLVGFAKITRDMTEKRAMLEQLHQSQKMEAVGQLTGGVAHDFNNLLTAILGNLDTLSRKLPPDATRLRRAVDHATQGAERAAALTQQLLAFARRQPLNPKPTNVNRLVQGMSDLIRRTLHENIVLHADLDDGTWNVEVDPHQLESALLNLAVNARDAMPGGGKLTIKTSNVVVTEQDARRADMVAGDYVTICVDDTGVGMTEEVRARAFDPFFTTKPIGEGTGLGLSQVFGFVKQSGGHIRLESEPGRGTTVKISLPRTKAEALYIDEAVLPATPQGRENETVLVVEDDDDVRMYSTESLRELGFIVLEATDGSSALRMLEEHPEINLLFTDVGLPGINGRELGTEALQRRPGLKVLFTTGYERNALMHDGRLDAGVELLTKPFTRAQLAQRVRGILDAGRQ